MLGAHSFCWFCYVVAQIFVTLVFRENKRLLFSRLVIENKWVSKGRGPGAVARSEACPLDMQAAPSSIPSSGTFFRGDLVLKKNLRPFSLFRWFKKSSCQLLAKECALSTGKLPRRLVQHSILWNTPGKGNKLNGQVNEISDIGKFSVDP